MALNPGDNGYEYSAPPVLPGSVMSAPYQYIPVGVQSNVSLTTVTTLTIPAGAEYAWITVSGAAARWTANGTTPSSTVGMPLAAGLLTKIEGPNFLTGFKIIGAGATMDVQYLK